MSTAKINRSDSHDQKKRVRIMVSLMRLMSLNPDADAIVKMVSSAMRKAYGPWTVILLSVRNMEPGEYLVTRFITQDGNEHINGMDPWYGDPARPTQQGGFLGKLIMNGEPRLLNDIEIDEDKWLGDALRPYHSLIAVPVYENGQIVNWMILALPDPDGFRHIDLEWGIMRANLIGATITQKHTNQQLREATARIQHEVDNIAALQRALLPPSPANSWGLNIEPYWRTYDRAGGDYYDFVPLDTTEGAQKTLLLVADASGHGPSAAVIVSMLHVILRSLQEINRPSLILEEINTRLFERRISNMFVTCWLGIYDSHTKCLAYASAGHLSPLFREASGAVELLDSAAGIPLGVSSQVNADERSVALQPECTVVLYTDGITEARAPDREQFGVARLQATLASSSGAADKICEHLLAAVDKHESGTRPVDDKCLVVIQGR